MDSAATEYELTLRERAFAVLASFERRGYANAPAPTWRDVQYLIDALDEARAEIADLKKRLDYPEFAR